MSEDLEGRVRGALERQVVPEVRAFARKLAEAAPGLSLIHI